ncbi:MAG: hypothetical protein KDA57_00330 [Planctomycetales bacterium]|nr:hypothetical protein [Planctomycetales bacterium]
MRPYQPTSKAPERLEQIVSYLDGELSAEESLQVEERLAADNEFRQELQSIDRAWSALDQLPLTTVEDRFAKTTLEMVIDTARREVDEQTQAIPVQQRRRSVRIAVLIASAALLSGLVFRFGWQNPNRALLADLPVIQNIEAYSQFQEIEFLRQLNPKQLDDFWSAETDELAAAVHQLTLISSLENRSSWLEGIAAEERVALRAKYNRFRSLPETRQQQLRQLHLKISTAEDAEQLRKTMLQYQRWLNTLPASEQYELRELPAGERAKRVDELLRRQAVNKSLDLTPQELQTFFLAVKPRLDEKKQEILARMSSHDREMYDATSGGRRARYLMFRLLLESRGDAEQLRLLLQDAIPEDKLQAFLNLPPEEKRQRFGIWIWQAAEQENSGRMRSGRRSSQEVSEKELEDYFTEELDAATIERLLALPRDKMQQELKRRYLGGVPREDLEEFIVRDFRPPLGPGPPPRPGEGGRRGAWQRPREFRDGRPGPPDRRPRELPLGFPGPEEDRPPPVERP